MRLASTGGASTQPQRAPESPYALVRLAVARTFGARWNAERGASSKQASR